MQGFTLVEVVVSLTLLALLSGLVTVGLATLAPTAEQELRRSCARARAEAIRTGRPVRFEQAVFLPDGSARGPGLDPLTGRDCAGR